MKKLQRIRKIKREQRKGFENWRDFVVACDDKRVMKKLGTRDLRKRLAGKTCRSWIKVIDLHQFETRQGFEVFWNYFEYDMED